MENQEKKLHDYIYDLGRDPLSLDSAEFKTWALELPQRIRVDFINTLRDHKKFYEKILEEEYRKTHPSSYRYSDAEKKIATANEKGKILKSIIDNHKS